MTTQHNQWPTDAGAPADDFSDLDSYGGEYRPQHAFRTGIDYLADGQYDCEVQSAALDMVKGDRICRIGLKTHTGAQVEWTVWLNRQEGLNGFCADLCVLGFDADKWGPAFNRPLSVELPKAVAKLAGLKFRAVKTSRKGTGSYEGKTYHDLRAQALLTGKPMPPPAAPANNGAAPAPKPIPDDQIPF